MAPCHAMETPTYPVPGLTLRALALLVTCPDWRLACPYEQLQPVCLSCLAWARCWRAAPRSHQWQGCPLAPLLLQISGQAGCRFDAQAHRQSCHHRRIQAVMRCPVLCCRCPAAVDQCLVGRRRCHSSCAPEGARAAPGRHPGGRLPLAHAHLLDCHCWTLAC
eukprot:363790-Chlamydomonas_euryale.AAC.11